MEIPFNARLKQIHGDRSYEGWESVPDFELGARLGRKVRTRTVLIPTPAEAEAANLARQNTDRSSRCISTDSRRDGGHEQLHGVLQSGMASRTRGLLVPRSECHSVALDCGSRSRRSGPSHLSPRRRWQGKFQERSARAGCSSCFLRREMSMRASICAATAHHRVLGADWSAGMVDDAIDVTATGCE